MSFSKCLMTAALVGVVSAAPACTHKPVADTKKEVGAALDATRAGADQAIAATKKAGDKTAEVAQRTAGEVADKSKEVASATGAALTDGWITTKVKAKFADETVLEGSHINVDTTDHVVTLRGTVLSRAAKGRAAAIAGGTEGVTRVVNQLVVKQT
jgi:hypothetical protein